jgi:hypothetical protein
VGEVIETAKLREAAEVLYSVQEAATVRFPESYFGDTALKLEKWADELEGKK